MNPARFTRRRGLDELATVLGRRGRVSYGDAGAGRRGGGLPRPGFEPGTPSLEARRDVRFTTGAEERKARDLNPHGLAAARLSKPARQTVSGYPPSACSRGGGAGGSTRFMAIRDVGPQDVLAATHDRQALVQLPVVEDQGLGPAPAS